MLFTILAYGGKSINLDQNTKLCDIATLETMVEVFIIALYTGLYI